MKVVIDSSDEKLLLLYSFICHTDISEIIKIGFTSSEAINIKKTFDDIKKMLVDTGIVKLKKNGF
ncbi:hypothetical protein HGO41_25330 [Rahnella sp. CG8]|uniref:hypothetical protein n=1 Tax=Rahnella sp. CG8 TaxID=2726078 RepID=UPI00203485EB|nr:hypothetical protein [Rahnella sp. CG8]MCM2448473.1 hypothetical protein [Rahnella sp. CG8]